MLVPISYKDLYKNRKNHIEGMTEQEATVALQSAKGLESIVFRDEKGILGKCAQDDPDNLRLLIETDRADWWELWERYHEDPDNSTNAQYDKQYQLAKKTKEETLKV